MHSHVKNFIEDNINEIDAQDWNEVISLWWSEMISNFTYDDELFTEFAKVLSQAGIDFLSSSQDVRRSFMRSLLSQYLNDEVESAHWKSRKEIKKSDIFLILDSNLGFSPEEVESLLDDIAEHDYNLGVDFTCYYVE